MKSPSFIKLEIDTLEFDDYGNYEITEILTNEELDDISGGRLIGFNICPGNIFCPTNDGCNPPPPPPPPNPNCGEDDDSNS